MCLASAVPLSVLGLIFAWLLWFRVVLLLAALEHECVCERCERCGEGFFLFLFKGHETENSWGLCCAAYIQIWLQRAKAKSAKPNYIHSQFPLHLKETFFVFCW